MRAKRAVIPISSQRRESALALLRTAKTNGRANWRDRPGAPVPDQTLLRCDCCRMRANGHDKSSPDACIPEMASEEAGRSRAIAPGVAQCGFLGRPGTRMATLLVTGGAG